MNSALWKFCSKIAKLGWNVFAKDAKKSDKPSDWITLENGTHVPVKEGQSHKDATESFIAKKQNKKMASSSSVEGEKSESAASTVKKQKEEAWSRLADKAAEWHKFRVAKKWLKLSKVADELVEAYEGAVNAGALDPSVPFLDVYKKDFFDKKPDFEATLGKKNTESVASEKHVSQSQKQKGNEKEQTAGNSFEGSGQPKFSKSDYGGKKPKTVQEKLEAAKYPGTLSENQKQALWDYSGRYFEQINHALRANHKGDLKETEDTRKELDSIFKNASLKTAMTVYRGMDADETIPWVRDLVSRQLKIGSRITDKAYMSTSANKKEAERFSSGVLFKITAPKGAKGVELKENSQNDDEDEVLFNRGSSLRVTKIKESKDKYGNIDYEISAYIE